MAFYNYQMADMFQNKVIEYMGYLFSLVFTIEAIIKIIAMGFIFNKKSYLRDSWNCLDFIIVIAGVIELSMIGKDSGNLSMFRALRTLRVFRPLKTIKNVSSMRKLVAALIGSIPELLNVGIFFLFIFILFGIMGLQQFSGSLYNKCRVTEKPLNATYWEHATHPSRNL
jgi:hypothetical protein